MSGQFRSGGGGRMQTPGYEGAHFPPTGGGGGGGAPPLRHAKPRTGCSSIPFGATPVCPCLKSKKATPTTRAFAQTLPTRRPATIWLRLIAVAPVVQGAEGI